MTSFYIVLDEAAALFYRRLAEEMKRPVERVLSDALFQLAGELSLEALHKKNPGQTIDFPQ